MATDLRPVMNRNLRFSPYVASMDYVSKEAEQRGRALRYSALLAGALAAEGIPAFSGYTFPLYRNPMFLKKRFINGAFPLGTAYHEDIDYRRFAAQCHGLCGAADLRIGSGRE